VANHKSALKRIRQNEKRNKRNRIIRSAARTHVKRTVAAIEAGEKDKAIELLRKAESAFGKATAKGVLHKSNASRRISRLAKRVAAMGA
jgi:small subunit ribosomal protein S20